jgi:DNA-binding NarL/FixJ family response regulator
LGVTASDVSVAVVEGGGSLTCELTLACHGSRLAVRGPVEDVASPVNMLREAGVIVVAVPAPETVSLVTVLRAFPGAAVLGMAESIDGALVAASVSLGARGVMARGAARHTVVDALCRAAAGELVVPAAYLPALLELPRAAAASDPLRALTARERQVLSLLSLGRSTQEIAGSLVISPLTVRSHVKSILAKLSAHSKVEAIRVAWRAGGVQVSGIA